MYFLQSLLVLFLTLIVTFCWAHPVTVEDQVQIPAESALRPQRQAGGGGGHHDAVDFGAHTGDHGAFGWYADFPVHGH